MEKRFGSGGIMGGQVCLLRWVAVGRQGIGGGGSGILFER